MEIILTTAEVQQFSQDYHSRGKTIAFVATMGGLHAGHFALVQKATQLADVVIVSIFVNPAQFGKNEDLATYPGILAEDKRLLADYNPNVIFTPSTQEIYPLSEGFKIVAPSIANTLCGHSRPVFFHGISLVVLKLLLITQADYAIFGEKDYQQLHIIRQLVADFFLATKIIVVPTVRNADGLAMSTRNQYLDKQQQQTASHLYRVLQKIKRLAQPQNLSITQLKQSTTNELSQYFTIDYVEIVQDKTLLPCEQYCDDMRLLSAVLLGKTRLIDNIRLL